MLPERLETPALIVDDAILRQNMAAMAEILKDSSLKLRPHFKSHKCPTLAHRQLAAGAVGMTCAKLSEAIELCDCGVEDILIANQIVQPSKISRLAQLALDCRLTVCADDMENLAALSKAAEEAGSVIHILIEYDIGMERCGVTEESDVAALALCANNLPHLKFDGIQAYAGHVSHMTDKTERERMAAENSRKVRHLLETLQKRGLSVRTVSGGSTGTAQIKANDSLYTELQAGSYLFMDATYRDLNLPFRNSLFVLSTVVSVREGLTVIDAGIKSCGVDQGFPKIYTLDGQPIEAEIVASEEHFQLHNPSLPSEIGDKLLLIPGHCCSTVNLYNSLYLVENGRVTDRLSVSARGMSR